MKKPNKKFRLNITISYMKGVNINNYQNPIQSIITNLAWLYRLEYSIDSGTNIFGNIENEMYQQPDIIYIRSTDETNISLKEFQNLIKTIFLYNGSGVEVNYQVQKYLTQYPFPTSYIKPLNYPYLEVFENGKGEIKIPTDELAKLFPDEKTDKKSH